MDNRTLVIMGNGWGSPEFVWIPMKSKFASEGFDSITFSYKGGGLGDIRESADVLARLTNVVREYYDHICFVGHSMGGLVGRWVIQKMDEGQNIDSYVSIGSPHNGSLLAFLAPWSQSAKQMQVESKFLKDLNSSPWPDTPALSIRGSLEEFVIPAENSKFHHAEDDIVIPYATHVSLLFNARTFFEIWGWLMFNVLKEDIRENTRGISSSLAS